MSTDPIVDEVRRVRDELVKQHGGLEGWIDHLQAMEQARTRKATKRASKPAALAASDRRKQKLRKPRSRIVVASRQ